MRGQQRVGAAQNERIDGCRQLRRALGAARRLQVGGAWLTAGKDRQLIPAQNEHVSKRTPNSHSGGDVLLAELRVGAEETLRL